MKRFLIAALIYGVCSAVCPGQNRTQGRLSLCEIAENIHTYSNQRVQIKAFLGKGAEQTVLYDPACQDGTPLVYVSFKTKVAGQLKQLRRIVAKRRYALVTIEGTMHGGEALTVDPSLPDWMKERFKNSQERYGHMNSLPMMIEIDKVLQVEDVSDGLTSAPAKN